MKNVVLAIHVAGGFTGLAAMLLPLIAKKGGRLHKRAGLVFVAGMGAAALSGVVMSIGFLLEGRTRHGVFFGVLSLLLGEGLWCALAAIRRKKSPDASRRPLDYLVPGALALAGAVGVAYGLMNARWLLVGFSTLSIAVSIGDLAFAARPLSSKMAWWYQHMGSMMGACIAAVTAFLVVNVDRLLGPIPNAVAWVPWVLPSAIIVPIFVMWIRHYRARFRELT